jgi:PASTA domain
MNNGLTWPLHEASRRRRLIVAIVAGAAWVLLGPAAAEAMTLSTGPDPVESVVTQLATSGTAPSSQSSFGLFVTVKAAGGQACAANIGADNGDEVISAGEDSGPYSATTNWTPQKAGSYLLCGWLQQNGNVIDHASLAFSVRIPHLSISIAAPATVRPNQIFQIVTTAQAEAQRSLAEYLIPNTGSGCPANAAAASDTSNSIEVGNWPIDGGPTSESENESFQNTGRWIICAYFQYNSFSDPPEAASSALLTVAHPPPRCVVPHFTHRMSLGAVEARIRAGHCSVGRVTLVYSNVVSRGRVVSLSLAQGTRLPSGTAVNIRESAGRKPKRKHRR